MQLQFRFRFEELLLCPARNFSQLCTSKSILNLQLGLHRVGTAAGRAARGRAPATIRLEATEPGRTTRRGCAVARYGFAHETHFKGYWHDHLFGGWVVGGILIEHQYPLRVQNGGRMPQKMKNANLYKVTILRIRC